MKINVPSPSDGRIPMRQQVTYALCEVASCPLYTIVFTFLTFFYTDILGMNAGTVGVVILVSKIFDGFSDLGAGNLIDHTHTKAGSARPWILRSAIPLALANLLLFTVPNVGNIGKILYIFVTYNFAMTIAFTINNCAINALPVYMSNDTSSRTSAYAIRTILAGVVQLAISMLFLNLVADFGGGQTGWIKVSAIIAAISLIFSLIVYFGTSERVTKVNEEPVISVPFKTAISSVLKNKYWFMVLAMILIIALHQVATLTVGVYYAKYILMDENLTGNLVLYHHAGAFVGMLAMPFILRFGITKRKSVFIAGVCMLLGSLISVFRGDGNLLIISLALRGMGFGVTNSLYYGMLADTVDFGEWKTGIRATAVTTSAASVGNKLGSGIGSALIGLALSGAGYDGLAEIQSASAVFCIRAIFVFLPLILYAALILLMCFYKLDAQLPEIRKELDTYES